MSSSQSWIPVARRQVLIILVRLCPIEPNRFKPIRIMCLFLWKALELDGRFGIYQAVFIRPLAYFFVNPVEDFLYWPI
jgi:hypothetical protein